MLKMYLKVNGTKYPITTIELVDCEPYIATILRGGIYENYINSKVQTAPNALDFDKVLIVENSKYAAFDRLIEEGVKIYLNDLISQDLGGK